MVTQSANMFRGASAFVLLAACWTSQPTVVDKPMTTEANPTTTANDERRATVRIDAQPGGKKFQGVWLEFAPDQRWVVDYRPREFWRPFEGHEVIVTGHCYRPVGQAIGATHFRVDRMRFARPERGRGPILEIGPEQMLRGTFAAHAFPAGTKMGGSSLMTFVADGGTTYWVLGVVDRKIADGTLARVKAREIVPDASYTAQPGGPNLWILDVRDPDSIEDPAHAPKIISCP